MAANKKKVHLSAVLCLALVAAAVATRPAAETCGVPTEVKACAQQVIEDYNKNNQGKVFSPDCCKKLASQLGCSCLVRDLVLAANIDTQEPFCVDGSGCK